MRVLLFLASVLALFPSPLPAAEARPIVAVFDVELRRVSFPRDVRESLADYLSGLLAQRGFQVVPRSQLQERLQSQKQASYKSCFEESCQIELGKELAADKSLATQVMKLGAKCRVTLTLYDLRRAASEAAGVASGACSEDGVVAALEEALATLLGTGSSSPAGAKPGMAPGPIDTRPGQDVSALDRWEVLNGEWRMRGGAILGRGEGDQGAHLILKHEPMADFVLDTTVEHLAGPHGGVHAGCRYEVYAGGPLHRFRGGTVDIQGPCLYLVQSGWVSGHIGHQGTWSQVLPADTKDAKKCPEAARGRMRVRHESLGSKQRLYVDGKLVAEITDPAHPRGNPLLYVASGHATVSFSDIRLYIPDRDSIPPPGPPSPVPAVALGPIEDLTDLSKFEILNGRWWTQEGAIHGSGGHLLLKGEPFRDFDLEFTVEHVSGPMLGLAGGFRHEVVPGGAKSFRGGTAINQGLTFNFMLSGAFMPVVGLGGQWYLVHPEWKAWRAFEPLKRHPTRVRIEGRGDRIRVLVDGEQADEFRESRFLEGSILFWVQDPAQVSRFYGIRLRRG